MNKRDAAMMRAMLIDGTTPEYRRKLEQERAILIRCGFRRDELMLLVDPKPGRMHDRFQYMPRKVADVWP
jgi:hypothetical protein